MEQEIKQAKGNVATAEGNIKRGYAIHSQTQPEPFVGTCGDPMTGTFYSCVLPGSKIVETPVAINLNEERKRIRLLKSGLRKLESQLSKTERRRSKAIGQCASLPVK